MLGAIVSPTDPIAATAIAQRLGLPRRLVGLIEGESLVNDGTALVAVRYAVAAVVTGSFSLASASADFLLSVAGGIAIGLAVGFLIRQVRRRLDNPPVEITISVLSGYFAYLPAHALDVSGVLAAVAAGIYLGWHTMELTSAQTRLQGLAVWEILFFLLNGLLFALVGLQLPVIVDALSGFSAARPCALCRGRDRRRDRRPLRLHLPRRLRRPPAAPRHVGYRPRSPGRARRSSPGPGCAARSRWRRRSRSRSRPTPAVCFRTASSSSSSPSPSSSARSSCRA